MHTPLFGDFRVSGWGFGLRGGVSGYGDDMRPAWKRGTPQQGHFHMHTPLFGDFRVSGWGRDDVRAAWKRGTPQQKHFHMHTPLFGDFSFFALQNIYSEMLQNSKTMPVSMECEINTQNKPGSPWRKLIAIHNFVASAFLHYKISTQKWFKFRRLCQWPWNVKSTQNKPGSPWRKLIAIHNFVASAFLHYKISTQKWFKFRRLCQWPWNVKSTLKTNLDRLGENWLLSTTS